MKKIIAMLLCAVMVFSMAACGNQSQTNDKKSGQNESEEKEVVDLDNWYTGEKVTVEYWHTFSGTNGQVFQQVIDNFNNSQDRVEVVATYQGNYSDLYAKTMLAVSSNSAPDLISVGYGQAGYLGLEEGVCANMLPYMEASDDMAVEDFVDNFISLYLNEEEETLTALPLGMSVPVMYCNKSMLDKAGVAVPTTWEELKAACEKLVDGGYCRYGFCQPYDAWYFWTIIRSWGGVDAFNEDATEFQCYDETLEAYEYLQDMIEHNYFYPGPQANGSTICLQMLANQECAFYITSIGSLFSVEETLASTGVELTVAAVPAGEVASTPSGGNSIIMTESSDNKEAAWEFIRWLYNSEDGLAYLDAQVGFLGCSDKIINSEVIQKKMSEDQHYAKAHEFLANVNNSHHNKGAATAVGTIVNAFIDSVLFDQDDVKTQLDILFEDAKDILAVNAE